MAITTKSGKVLPGPSVGKPIVDDVVDLEVESEEEHPVESEKLENNEVPSNQKALQRYEEFNLVLNWEKCHFMVKEGIALEHWISAKGVEVDRAKVKVIEKLPPPISEKGLRSFLGYAGFYRRFIKDFSKIENPLCKLLEKEAKFVFDDDFMKAFQCLKEKLVAVLIILLQIGLDHSK
ncbi:uncharacterized mitochondrial protein AtMg00860-like [Capsicum annuum]|uniref:uncharacterized mitochondrial protein AtMg00860-like n=1 Tax=Capsicum annuum TaxID=4072 RepID=UPI001FB0C30D|nr:uncharacterized mitochondrial protein AtMg00860-like [Capsicum annuum]